MFELLKRKTANEQRETNQGCGVAQVTAEKEVCTSTVHQAVVCSKNELISSLQHSNQANL
jgi:hypothetical protein